MHGGHTFDAGSYEVLMDDGGWAGALRSEPCDLRFI
jgi:hypothetical protein